MGIQINGQTDTVTSTTAGGKVTVTPASFPSVDNLNVTGIITASNVRTNSLVVSGITTVPAGTAAAPSISPTGNSNTGIYFPSANTLAFSGGGSERLRIDNAGRIGMGTDNPTVALQLSPDASISNVNVNNPLSSVAGAALTVAQFVHTNANGSYLRIKATRLSNGSSWTTASTKIVQVTDVTEQAYIEFNPSGGNYGMAFGGYNDTNGLTEERLRIDSRGRVTMPYQPVCDVYGTGTCTVTDGTTQNLTLSTFNYNRGFSITSNKLVIPKTGYYFLTTNYISAINGSGYSIRAIRIFPRINGTVLGYPDARWNSAPTAGFSNTHYEIKHNWTINLVENDQLDLQVAIYHNKGSALNDTYYTSIITYLLG